MGKTHVSNEVGALKRALVHRPGHETQRYPHGDFLQAFPLRPSCTDFDLEKAQTEHDRLTKVLAAHNVEVIEATDLLAETLEASPEAKKALIDAYLADSRIEGIELTEAARCYLESSSTSTQLVERLFEGIRYGDTDVVNADRFPLAALSGNAFDPETFLASPLNTAFFVRDPLSVIGEGITLNHMYWHDRNREVDLLEAVTRHHPDFAATQRWFDHRCSFHLEGGDIVNLNAHSVAVGLSSRTEGAAIDVLCRQLLWGRGESDIADIYVFFVPQMGNRLHLDTYVSRIDYDTFVIDPAIARNPSVLRVRAGRRKGNVRIDELSGSLKDIFRKALSIGPVRLMDFGSSAESRMEFEYGNGATGMLCLSPGNLCVSEENVVANDLLDKAGMTLHPVSVQEMTVGFGGPSSLCLPLWREDVQGMPPWTSERTSEPSECASTCPKQTSRKE